MVTGFFLYLFLYLNAHTSELAQFKSVEGPPPKKRRTLRIEGKHLGQVLFNLLVKRKD